MTKHGMKNTRLYNIWHGVKRRCCAENDKHYPQYGARGIELCEEWENSFMAFYNWAMSHGYADNLTLDRLNNDAGYSPENCRWATMKEQQNNRGNNRIIAYDGKTKTVAEWAQYLGCKPNTLHKRLSLGWSDERCLTQPVRRRMV